MKILFLTLFTCTLFIACSSKDESPLGRIEQSKIVDEFKGQSIGIMRDVRFIALSPEQQIEFSLDSSGNPVFSQPQPDDIKVTVDNTRKRLKDLGIVGFFSLNDNAVFIFTTYADSSYADVVKHNENYIDRSILADDKEHTPYRYVYVYTYPGKGAAELERLRRTHTTFRKRDNWYYFRTFDFKEYKEF